MTTITLRVLNFLPADADAANGLNLNATVDAYCRQVEAAVTPIALEWNVDRNTEGADVIDTDDAEDRAEIENAMSGVFNNGGFWVYA